MYCSYIRTYMYLVHVGKFSYLNTSGVTGVGLLVRSLTEDLRVIILLFVCLL